MSKPVAIVLNGASSSGKTSIVRALQRLSSVPMLHASLDVFTDMFDWTSVRDEATRRECHRVGVGNFHSALAILASGPFPVVVDHVFERRAWFESCSAALGASRAYWVGIRCPVEILEVRERNRGDRRTGMARWQADRVHQGMSYDLELDTSLLSPNQCAERILAMSAIPQVANPSMHPTPAPVTPAAGPRAPGP